jgi:carboxymethylenebutenolidase
MSREQISIRTEDGDCRAWVFTPQGSGPWPAVIFYMDGLAIRPALLDMGQRMADRGYVVLLPDLFYRAGLYEPLDPEAVFAMANPRDAIGPLMDSTDTAKAAEDTAAFIAYLDTRKDIAGRKIGTTGYCMGGGMALAAAAAYPDRIAAAASFHGGRLATDSPLSPHLQAPKIKATVYVAGADKDAHYPPEEAARLDNALTEAGVTHRCEIYEGALHGWTQTDFPIYNAEADARHWRELSALFDGALR